MPALIGALVLGLVGLAFRLEQTAGGAAGSVLLEAPETEATAQAVSAGSLDMDVAIVDMARFGGKSYLLVGAGDGSGVNWTDSEAFAQSLGGHLATIDNQAEQDFLAHQWGREPGTATDAYALWLGLWDSDGSDTFDNWADGTPVDYTNYNTAHREPDQAAEDYIAMWVDWGGCGQPSAGNRWFNTRNDASNSCGLGRHYYGVIELPAAATRTAPFGMVSWWPGDGNARDIVGSNDGIVHGASFSVEGKVGGAIEFDGPSDRIEIPEDPSLRLQRFTLEAWVYLRSASSQSIVGKHIAGTTFDSYRIGVAGEVTALISDGMSSAVDLLSGVEPPLNEFFHVALTWDGDQAKLYLNGSLIDAADPVDFNVGYTATPVFLGADHNGPDHGSDRELDARIDELAIFNRALSRREIEDIYNSGDSGKWRDADGDGVADRLDLCSDSLGGDPVDDSGCSNAGIDGG